MESMYDVPPEIENKKIFKEFVKFLYFDEMSLQNDSKNKLSI